MTDQPLSLAEEFEAAVLEQTRGPECSVRRAMAQMPEADQLTLQSYLKGNRLHATVIREKLALRGIDCAVDSVRRHRRMLRGESGGCECRPIKS